MHTEIVLNLLLATLIGAAIGLERQWRQRFIGLSTNALVALGAASFTSLSLLFTDDASPTRMAAQVVSGIGFLGAGVIMRDGFSVRGLSTAATLWCSAAVGTLAGAGFILLAMQVGGMILLTNLLLHPLARFINRQTLQEQDQEQFYRIELTCKTSEEARIRAELLRGIAGDKLRLQNLESHALKDSGSVDVSALVYAIDREDEALDRLVGRILVAQVGDLGTHGLGDIAEALDAGQLVPRHDVWQ